MVSADNEICVVHAVDCSTPTGPFYLSDKEKRRKKLGLMRPSEAGYAVVSYAGQYPKRHCGARRHLIRMQRKRLWARQTPPPSTVVSSLGENLAPDPLGHLCLGPALHGDSPHEIDLFTLEPQLSLSKLTLPKLHALLFGLDGCVLQSWRCEAALPGKGGAVGSWG